ncbi:MAG: TetR/AcrR family transcriptional regulator [Anaerolineales bacterium]
MSNISSVVPKKTDPRVLRTRQMLREALIAVILDKGYDAANIADITDRAGLRRATFYLHYRDKEDLLLSLMRETLDDLIARIEAVSGHRLSSEREAEELIAFQHARENADLYRAILSGQGAAEILRGIRAHLAARIRENCLAERPGFEPAIPIDVVANYMAAVKLNMITWWLDQGMPYTPEQMAAMCARLVWDGAGAILEPAGA